MEVKGTLEQAGNVTEWNNNKYQWGKIAGSEVRFINQDNSSLVGREVHFIDRSEEGNSIQIKQKKDGTEYAAIGGGKHVELWVDGQAVSKIQPGGQAQASQGQKQGGSSAWGGGQTQASKSSPAASQGPKADNSFEERCKYGINAVKIALEQMGLADYPMQDVLSCPLLASVYNSSMYAFKDDVPLREPVSATEKAFNTTPANGPGPDGPFEGDDDSIPF